MDRSSNNVKHGGGFLTMFIQPKFVCGVIMSGMVTFAALHLLLSGGGFLILRQPQMNRPPDIVATEEWFSPNITTEMYLMSAYYDDRPTIDPRTRPAIRIMGMAHKDKIEKEKLFCIVTYEGLETPMLQDMVATDIGAGANRHGKFFREYIFVCAPLKIPNRKAEYISVVDQTYLSQSKWESDQHVRIPVRYPSNVYKVDFASCVSITYWTFDPYRIVEWVELHRLWGVKEINIYGSMVNEATERVFLYYHEEGILTYTRVPRPMTEEGEVMFHLMATPVINDCIYKNMYRYKKIVVTDLDEMIVPRGDLLTYYDLLEAIENESRSSHPHRMYNFRNVYYFSELPQNTSEPLYTLTLRQSFHLRELTPVGTSTKTIMDPMVCRNMHNHFCWKVAETFKRTPHSIRVNEKFARNQHYKKCHFDKYRQAYNLPPCAEALKNYTYDPTMFRFKEKLLINMERVLKDLGLYKDGKITKKN